MEEKIFYDNGSVKVTSARFVTSNGDTYSLATVSSIKMRVKSLELERLKNKIIGYGAIALGALIAIGSIFDGFSIGGIIFGLLAIAIGYLFLKTQPEDTYHVITASASGESEALFSTDKNEVQKIVNALNEAIIHRG